MKTIGLSSTVQTLIFRVFMVATFFIVPVWTLSLDVRGGKKPWWDGSRLRLLWTWDELKEWMLPSSVTALVRWPALYMHLCQCLCGVLCATFVPPFTPFLCSSLQTLSLVFSTFYSMLLLLSLLRSTDAKQPPRSLSTHPALAFVSRAGSAAGPLLRALLLTVVGLAMLLVTARPLDRIAPGFDKSVPFQALQLRDHAWIRGLGVELPSSGYGLFRSMTGVWHEHI